jgi:hypothetical protein
MLPNAMVDKTLCYTLLCVCYMEAWYIPICLVTLPNAMVDKTLCYTLLRGGLVYTDLSGYVDKCVYTLCKVTRQIGVYQAST